MLVARADRIKYNRLEINGEAGLICLVAELCHSQVVSRLLEAVTLLIISPFSLRLQHSLIWLAPSLRLSASCHSRQ
jgi:hypothetical protein